MTSSMCWGAILYVVKTGCQWRMLPAEYPPHNTVYHHFRTWSERGWFQGLCKLLVAARRVEVGRNESASVAVVDSQSVRSALPQSQKGVDGYKRVKGIKRHIAVDSQGYPLAWIVTKANIHDSKAANGLIDLTVETNPDIKLIKADKDYSGLEKILSHNERVVRIECVKSNFGTSDFIPMQGRWVVERTFSWMESYRRLNRNYEKFLHTAVHILSVAIFSFMLRYFR